MSQHGILKGKTRDVRPVSTEDDSLGDAKGAGIFAAEVSGEESV